MTTDAWSLIASDAPRMWDWYDARGRWLGRDVAIDADAALGDATSHLATDGCLAGTKATITVRCLATDERARTTTTIITGLSCLPLY